MAGAYPINESILLKAVLRKQESISNRLAGQQEPILLKAQLWQQKPILLELKAELR